MPDIARATSTQVKRGPDPASHHERNRRFAVLWFPFASPVVQTLAVDFVGKLLRVTPALEVIGSLPPSTSHNGRVQSHRMPFGMHYVAAANHRNIATVAWVAKLVLFQVVASIYVAILRSRLKGVVFYLVGPYAVLPIAVCRLFRIPCVFCITGSSPRTTTGGRTKRNMLYALHRLTLLSANYIALESALLRDQWNLSDFKEKVLPFYVARGVDFDLFRPVGKPSTREMAFGYMGRLSDEKGVQILLEAARLTLRRLPLASFVITGRGPLEAVVDRVVAELPEGRAVYQGWVPRARVPEILNRLRILVLPTSWAEGLPTILLEAMACGTPVLTTTVGAIEEVVVDNKTGFTIRQLNAEGLAEDICAALQNQRLDEIAAAEYDLISRNYAPGVVDSHLGGILRLLEQRST